MSLSHWPLYFSDQAFLWSSGPDRPKNEKNFEGFESLKHLLHFLGCLCFGCEYDDIIELWTMMKYHNDVAMIEYPFPKLTLCFKECATKHPFDWRGEVEMLFGKIPFEHFLARGFPYFLSSKKTIQD